MNGTLEVQGPDPDAQHRLREQQENKARAAQRLPQVPGPQRQGSRSAADVQQNYCAEIAHVSSKNRKATVEGAAQLAIRVTSPNAGCAAKKTHRQLVHIVFVLKP
ncbi:hypothetical protein CB1_000174002 [Camelus ferus]|nr:hypothetical protein CB1_000174002 [Camelus ferus]